MLAKIKKRNKTTKARYIFCKQETKQPEGRPSNEVQNSRIFYDIAYFFLLCIFSRHDDFGKQNEKSMLLQAL